MKKWYHPIELVVDRLVPPTVVLLLIIIILEFFFHETAEHYHTAILIADYFIIALFSLDLFFKYLRIRNIPKFLRSSWLDIIAIFPFFLIFRTFETILIFTELQKDLKNVQLVLHETIEISKGTSKVIKEAEAAGKISRVKTILRIFQPLQRSPRLVKALAFYEHPTGKHHLHKVKGKKQYQKIKKIGRKVEKEVADKTTAPLSLFEKVFRKKK